MSQPGFKKQLLKTVCSAQNLPKSPKISPKLTLENGHIGGLENGLWATSTPLVSYHEPLSSFAFNLNLRRYMEEQVADLSIWDMDPLALSEFSLRLFMVGRWRLTPG